MKRRHKHKIGNPRNSAVSDERENGENWREMESSGVAGRALVGEVGGNAVEKEGGKALAQEKFWMWLNRRPYRRLRMHEI